ncbi:MAG: SPOR domain-containing protein [Holosporaceae bacterium]|nr:SPOR domain-containing protein [Holosporaceae bacterium]
MCPFIDDEDGDYSEDVLQNSQKGTGLRSHFFRDDRKFFLIGGGVSIVAFSMMVYVIYSSSKPINLEELPVISADGTPFKIKPAGNEQVKHQDKIVYDNISGDRRKTEEKIAQPPEEILSIPEIENGESLSDDEKKNIIRAFEDLAPEKEYQIKYVKKNAPKIKSDGLTIIEEEHRSPINRIDRKTPPVLAKKSKQQLRDIIEKTDNSTKDTIARGNGFMLQIASVMTRPAAEAEYNRILLKNKFLKERGKKIVKVDLGEKKGIRYRIQVGPFKTKEEADRTISTMKKNGFGAYISK